MRKIKLTQGQYAIVDDEDFGWLNQWRWQAAWQPNIQSYYAVRTDRSGLNQRTTLMHREIMQTPPHLQCDHNNHNGLDNQKHNLKNCTRSENQVNRKSVNSNNKLGIRGVFAEKGKFVAIIKRRGIQRRLGTFATIKEATIARRTAEEE